KKLSRGKLIYLPLFKNKFDTKDLLFKSFLNPSYIIKDFGQKKIIFDPRWDSNIEVALLDSGNNLSALHSIKQGFFSGEDLQQFLDEIASCFFQLSKQEII